MIDDQENLIDVRAAAKLLCLSTRSIYDKAARRELPHVRIGPRCVRFDPRELRRWIQERSELEE